jgi:hypothetical protein
MKIYKLYNFCNTCEPFFNSVEINLSLDDIQIQITVTTRQLANDSQLETKFYKINSWAR